MMTNRTKEVRKLLWPSLATILPILIAILHYSINPRFYFIDDAQTQLWPTYYEIGQILSSGEWPWVSLDSWFGGNLVGEYVYALYNPVSLALYWTLSQFDNLAFGGLFFISTHIAIGSIGTYFLARHLQITPSYSALAAFIIGSNNNLLYWWSASWVAVLASLAWVPWAVLFSLKCLDDRRYIFGASIFIYMVIASGYPNTVMALVVILGLLVLFQWIKEKNILSTTSLMIAGISSSLMSLPILYPFISSYAFSLRSAGELPWPNYNRFLSASLSGLLNFSFPSYLSVANIFGSPFSIINIPMYYVAWFLMIPIVGMRWNQISAPSQKALLGLIIILAVFFFVSLMPTILPMRWSFKFLVFYHATLALAGCWILSRQGLIVLNRQRIFVMAGLLSLTAIVSLELSITNWKLHLSYYLALLAFLLLFPYFHRKSTSAGATFLLITAFVIMIPSAATWERNPHLPDPGLNPDLNEYSYQTGAQGENVFTIANHATFCCDPQYQKVTPIGNGVFLSDRNFINGYTVLRPATIARRFCMDTWGKVCPNASKGLFERDHVTGLTYADLMRLDRLIVQKGPHLKKFLNQEPNDWVEESRNPHAINYIRRDPPPEMSGRISYLPEGVTAKPIQVSDLKERHLLKLESDHEEGIVVFQRAWYPGYQATLNDNPIEVYAHSDFITAVKLPATNEAEAILELTFNPPGTPFTYWWALIGAALSLGASYWRRTNFKNKPLAS